MASLGGGRTAPGDTLQGGDIWRKQILWLNLQGIVDKWGWTGEKGAGWHLPGGWAKRSSVFLQEKIGVTPLVTALGVTDPSDATERSTDPVRGKRTSARKTTKILQTALMRRWRCLSDYCRFLADVDRLPLTGSVDRLGRWSLKRKVEGKSRRKVFITGAKR